MHRVHGEGGFVYVSRRQSQGDGRSKGGYGGVCLCVCGGRQYVIASFAYYCLGLLQTDWLIPY